VVEAIAGALEFLESEPERAREMGRHAREVAIREHGWDKIREELEAAYRDALST
jgi:glycosyltransferase involved in cell wall biosynthesis